MKKIPVSQPELTPLCKEYATDAINAGAISGLFGGYIEKFENAFAKFCGVNHCISCSNGTTAIHLALLAVGVKQGDEVLVSATTNMATFFAVEYLGAVPIPVDIDPLTYTIDPADLQNKVSDKSVAILCVHLFGQLCDMNAIKQIASKNELKIVEDCAEAHGASYFGRKAGSFGDVSAFSFFSNKLLTCGEGGAVVTNDAAISEKVRDLKSLAFGKTSKFLHEDLGYNYRLTNIACAIGFSQTQQADKLINQRIKVCEKYINEFSEISEFIKAPIKRDAYFNTHWMAHFQLTSNAKIKREEFLQKLRENGIETREGFIPYTLQTYRGKVVDLNSCPIANSLAFNTFYLPTFNSISDDDQSYIINTVKRILLK
ncbi:DegT/DnrJ/EryC1/StrS family aminotransferase [Alphaproteobacteria bacterium]|nr:DegT/DnrJ/EryC1/StrS family aminotransferase [Alphaproteobacteria bacterium]